jgi:tagatose-1,6-bisphosphate aldolase
MLESEMVDACYTYLLNNNVDYTKVVREVPFLSRCIDMVLLDNSGLAITIEFKISNWKHAIDQVRNHMLGADKVYICLPYRKPSDKLINNLKQEKIGLFLFQNNEDIPIVEYLSAPTNDKKVSIFNDMLVNAVKSISCQSQKIKTLNE